MALDTQSTSAAPPSSYPISYYGLPRLPLPHSSPRLDQNYPYFYQDQTQTQNHQNLNQTQLPGNFHAQEQTALENYTLVPTKLTQLESVSTPMDITMNTSMNTSSMEATSIPQLLNHPMIGSEHNRANNINHHNITMNYPTPLRSNSWDGQAMMPYPWGLPNSFERHRGSQPDLGLPPSSTVSFNTNNYHPNFHSINFNQQLYPQPNLTESNSFSNPYHDGRSYDMLHSPVSFSYGKPYDKSSPSRGLAMFTEPTFTDRPHLCQIPNCGRMFKRLEHLKRHHRSIHTHERPYPCRYPKCSKAFSRSDNLAQHMRIHRQDPQNEL